MITVTISGRAGSGKSTLAMKRYEEFKAEGKSVAMLDGYSYGDYFSDDKARTNPDVKIVTKLNNKYLEEVQS